MKTIASAIIVSCLSVSSLSAQQEWTNSLANVGNTITDFIKTTVSSPALKFEYQDKDTAYFAVKKSKNGFKTKDNPEGVVSIPDELWSRNTAIWYGAFYRLEEVKITKDLAIGFDTTPFFDFTEKRKSFQTRITDGLGGSSGYCSDFKTDLLLRNLGSLNTDMYLRYNAISLCSELNLYSKYMKISYSGDKWYYRKDGDSVEQAKLDNNHESIHSDYESSYGELDVGIGVKAEFDGKYIVVKTKWAPGSAYSPNISIGFAMSDFRGTAQTPAVSP